jgi:hypothetical protein
MHQPQVLRFPLGVTKLLTFLWLKKVIWLAKFQWVKKYTALFTVAKLQKQPRCPTADEWIKKMWYLYTMEFYSAMKKNEILSFASKWIEPENIILREVSQAQKAKNHMFSLICRLWT